METKKCSKCGEEKPLSEFYKDPNPKNKSGVRGRCKACYAEMRKANRDKINEYAKKYREERREELKEKAREWRKKNPGCHKPVMKRKANSSNLRFKKLNGSLARYFPELTQEKLEELFDGKCYLCKKEITPETCHIEHKLPFAKGGTNELSNVGFTCAMCNKLKGKLTPDEFLDKLDRILDNYKHLCKG